MRVRYQKLFFFVALFGLIILTDHSFAGNPAIADTTQKQRENLTYNGIYRQNIAPGFFGNEYGNPIKTLLVADINPNVVLFNSKNSRFFFLFSPRVKLRLLSGYHSPVKSPSYMPGGTLFFRFSHDTDRPQFFSIAYSHHSNGQEGPTLDAMGNFNREDGKFTTNFYSLNYYRGKRKVNDTVSRSQYSFIGIELHTGLFNTGFSEQLTGKYGFVRANGSWMYDLLRDKHNTSDLYQTHQRLQAQFTYILDKDYNYQITDLQKRLNISLKYYYQFGFMENVAFTIGAGYRGQDDYNIYFQDSYAYVAVGVAYGVSFDLQKRHHAHTL
ncbi:hypothetical protein ACFGVR_20600 [Mucilaginibacter sp. AW1-3]